jgi:hypothetical protein
VLQAVPQRRLLLVAKARWPEALNWGVRGGWFALLCVSRCVTVGGQ